MTLINLTSLQTALDAPEPILNGAIAVTYWAGSGPFVNIDGASVTFPSPIRVAITNGVPAAPIELTPTGGVCCVRWQIASATEPIAVTRFTEIPDTGPVDFGDLPAVNPLTFSPVTDPTLLESLAQLIHDATYDKF